MTIRKPGVDIVIVGLGWTGGIMLRELAETGLRVLALERGPDRRADAPEQDDLRFAHRHALMQDVSRETLTFRNHAGQTALPMRQLGSFLIGDGSGGGGVTWNGLTTRFHPWDHSPLAHLGEHGLVPDNMLLQDWGVSYEDLEPHYDRFEYLCGTSGQAGNIEGRLIEGGNPFEGPRRRDYPQPPLIQSRAGRLFTAAAHELGLHPFPIPASNASHRYVNPDGLVLEPCHYCGFCDRFRCIAGAKASPLTTVIPAASRFANVEIRHDAPVLRVELGRDRTRATGVTYREGDAEVFQPADLVVLAAYPLANVHLMLLSGIGQPYDPVAGTGVVGRSYAYQIASGANAFFSRDTRFDPFIGAGALGMTLDDFNNGAVDHGAMGWLGGASLSCHSIGARPIGHRPVPSGTPRWGRTWKQQVARYYDHSAAVRAAGSVMAYRQNYLDLDPTYTDAYGRPLLRMTFDFQANELAVANFAADQAVRIARAMGAERVDRVGPQSPYSIATYQSSHNTGGAPMGTDPARSAVNRYLQSWDVHNVFVAGASAFPQNAGKNPTQPAAALTTWAATAIRASYLAHPGPLQ